MFSVPESISERIYKDDVVYRPPLECESVLVEVMWGCSYSGCTFCTEECLKRFERKDLDAIKRDLDLLATVPACRGRDSLFLLGQNALVLPTDFLAEIITYAKMCLPDVKHINMYARAWDVLHKGEADLRKLKAMGMGILYIGVETGSPMVMERVKKGIDPENMLKAFQLLDELGIRYSCSSIIGLGGPEYCGEHAIRTAQFYNKIHPVSIRVMTLKPWPGTTLYKEIEEGKFTLMCPEDMLIEECLFLQNLNVENCVFLASHVTDGFPVAGHLPEDKPAMLAALQNAYITGQASNLVPQEIDHM